MIKNTGSSCIIQLPKYIDTRGNLSVIEELNAIPFKISRAYWIYDVPGGETRGGHAYQKNCEFIVALSGSFDVILTTRSGKKQRYHLNRSYYGVYVPCGTWRIMDNFSTNSLALVLASEPYDEQDYILDFDVFSNDVQKDNADGVNDNVTVDVQPLTKCGNKRPSVYDCSVVELDKFHDPEGNLTPIYSNVHVPFDIKRVFYLYDIPGGESRGAHSHKLCHQFIVAASGAFEVMLDDGINKRTVQLNRPFYGLHIPPGIWASEQGFSSGSVCLVLASDTYIEDDYIRNYTDFINNRKRL